MLAWLRDTLCEAAQNPLVFVGLLVLGWVQPVLILVSTTVCYWVHRDLVQLHWYLGLFSLIPMVWSLLKQRVILVPENHYVLLRSQSWNLGQVLESGWHILWPWQSVDTRLTQGNLFFTKDTVFVYEIPLYDGQVDHILTMGALREQVSDVKHAVPMLFVDMEKSKQLIVNRCKERATPVIILQDEEQMKKLNLPPYIQGLSLACIVPPLPETVPRGVRRRGSVGQKKKQ